MTDAITLTPGQITLAQLRRVAAGSVEVVLDPACDADIAAATALIDRIVAEDRTVYGVSTGFGLLANKRIPQEDLAALQRNLVLSHCTGVGAPLTDDLVRLVMALKATGLARGCSGVRRELIDMLLRLLNAEVYPVIPSKGSVGASGDLAPLAHLAAALLGVGEVRYRGEVLPAAFGLKRAGVAPLALGPKEGLALINGTQVSTALALKGLFATGDLFAAAAVSGALSTDAAQGSDVPFDARIAEVRGQAGQIAMAGVYRRLVGDSSIRDSHVECPRVQDPYSLRCQPQVMGACLDQIAHVAVILEREANAATDNPLLFTAEGDVLSGGNFHAEPVAMAADNLALAIAETGALAERRIALLLDPSFSGLPAFLVAEGGINSGFMNAQVTAAALVSENKGLAHPASVDSLPTSANQEDHVSMATWAARRLTDMTENAATVIALELLCGAQGIEFHRPLKSSALLEEVMADIRARVARWESDRYFAADIEPVLTMVTSGALRRFVPGLLPDGD
ncbi:MAG: histidine ammonia-lyase [Pseudomonadota bacterium]